MKKFVVGGLFAISLLTIPQQEASAWVNSRFGIGLNWDWQSGGNQLLWGAWRNGQPPGPEAFNSGAYHPRYQGPMPGYMPQGGMPHGMGPMPQPYGHQGFAPQPFAPAQGFAPQPFAPQPFAPQGFFEAQSAEPPFAGMYSSPYQFANYPRPTYYPQSYYYHGR